VADAVALGQSAHLTACPVVEDPGAIGVPDGLRREGRPKRHGGGLVVRGDKYVGLPSAGAGGAERSFFFQTVMPNRATSMRL
jgi:hypothetical protein